MRQAETRQTIPSTAKALSQQQQARQHKPNRLAQNNLEVQDQHPSATGKHSLTTLNTPCDQRQEPTTLPSTGPSPAPPREAKRCSPQARSNPPPNFHGPNVSHRSDSDLTYRRLHAARLPAQGHHTGRSLTPGNRKANAPTSVSFTSFLRSQALYLHLFFPMPT